MTTDNTSVISSYGNMDFISVVERLYMGNELPERIKWIETLPLFQQRTAYGQLYVVLQSQEPNRSGRVEETLLKWRAITEIYNDPELGERLGLKRSVD